MAGFVARSKKAFVALLGTFVSGVLAAGLQKNGVPGTPEVIAAGVTAVLAALAVYRANNADPKRPPATS